MIQFEHTPRTQASAANPFHVGFAARLVRTRLSAPVITVAGPFEDAVH